MSERLILSRYAYKGRAVRLRVDDVQMPSGRRTTREVVEHRDSVAIVPIDKDGNFLLIRQYRHSIGKELIEIPAGGIEPGETLEEAVRRELREEIGYFPRRIEKLGGFYASPGYCTEYLHLFLASELEPSSLPAPDAEVIKLFTVPQKEIKRLLYSGEIEDAKTIAGLSLALNKLECSG